MMPDQTIIIGAGPAGLAVGACLKQAGLSCVILEQSDVVGSAWHQHYDRLHLHTAKAYSALPFMPFPKDYPRYPSRAQVISYLEAYARQFQLEPSLVNKSFGRGMPIGVGKFRRRTLTIGRQIL